MMGDIRQASSPQPQAGAPSPFLGEGWGKGAVEKSHDLTTLTPRLRGRLRRNVPLGPRTWFQVGGPAEWLFTPEDADDLALFLRERPGDLPLTVIGVGSNLLVRDGGIEGVVIRLGRGFAGIAIEAGHRLRVGAAALDVHVAQVAAEQGIGGLEFLSGIPGTVGGACKMNGGAYGSETADRLVWARLLDTEGRLHQMTPGELGYRYRHCDAPADWIFIEALLQGEPGEAAAIAERMAKIAADRAETQPVKARTGGSTFTNPPGQKAWQLIDRAGCRGLRLGQAQVSEKHCNFLINHGGASAADIEALGEEVRARVLAESGIELHWEIQRIGREG